MDDGLEGVNYAGWENDGRQFRLLQLNVFTCHLF